MSKGTFEAIASEWFAKKQTVIAPTTAKTIKLLLKNNVFTWIGNRTIYEINAQDLLAILRRVECRGALDTAHRCREYSG